MNSQLFRSKNQTGTITVRYRSRVNVALLDIQVISHHVITGEEGEKYCETLPAPFERDDSEFSGGVPIEKTNILNLPCHKVYIL